MIIGLAGGMASGKSSILKFLSRPNCQIIDLDKVAFSVFNKPHIHERIMSYFSCKLNVPPSHITRKTIQQCIALSDADHAFLTGLMHPEVRSYCTELITSSDHRHHMIAIPLIHDSTRRDYQLDRIIGLECSYDTQIQRIKQRDKINKDIAAKLLDRQCTPSTLHRLCDIIINTDHDDILQSTASVQRYLSTLNFT